MALRGEELESLRAANAGLQQELEVLRGVLALVKEDLHVKDEQIEHLYHSFLASKEHKRQEQERRELQWQAKMDRLHLELDAQKRAAATSRGRPDASQSKTTDRIRDAEWQALYRERHVIERNRSTGKAVITTLNGHTGTVTCLQFHDKTLVSGSDDGSMMLWSLSPREDDSTPGGSIASPVCALMQQHHRQRRNVEKRHSFYGHGGPIWALHFDDDALLFSGSYDKTVKIWELWSGKCLRTLRGHAGWVSSLDSHGDVIASSSWDSCIMLWDKRTGALLRTLHDTPANPIYALKWDRCRGVFVVGCRRFGVQLWDVETGQKRAEFIGHDANNQVNAIKACGDRIVSGGSDSTVKIWDRRQTASVSTLSAHRGAVMCVDYDNDHHVVSGSYDSTIKLWDLRAPTAPLSSLEGHSSAVFSLQMDACKVISGSADTTIKIFGF
ncbi:hypothetical protein P43SY_006058 [Pythium insidiosum]|uniref:Uncharacterized protein n=1 Tax=Pythium insidiosum TaxID=114742 RepID=A0AAD5Q4Z7_PYTIN|nr:hypothetical protein P43SY_006058 [Pythium insidiosum]